MPRLESLGSGCEELSLCAGRWRGKQTPHRHYHRGGSRLGGSSCRTNLIWANTMEADAPVIHGGHYLPAEP